MRHPHPITPHWRPPNLPPQLCPPTGGYVIAYMQYGDVPTTSSLCVLLGYYALQWGLVAAVLRWRYARLRPAQHLGAAPPPLPPPGAKRSGASASSSSGDSPKHYAPLYASEEGVA